MVRPDFSSGRPGGLGDNDIWMAKRLDKTWQKWTDPVNLECFFSPQLIDQGRIGDPDILWMGGPLHNAGPQAA